MRVCVCVCVCVCLFMGGCVSMCSHNGKKSHEVDEDINQGRHLPEFPRINFLTRVTDM